MEKRINKRIETYVTTFKDDVRKKISSLEFDDTHKTEVNELLEFVYDYERLVIEKDDLIKRKRIKNAIPVLNRCNAKRANGEQCTRRRKDKCEYCGTHVKGTPHGLVTATDVNNETLHNIEVIAQEICGIVYYIDKFNNVYNTEDIMQGKQNPSIISKYVKHNGIYSIPGLGI